MRVSDAYLRPVNHRPQIYSALDLGTNNCRLLVARPTRRGFRVVDAFSRIVRLGEGLGQTGRLSDAAMDRAISALRVCARKMRRHRVSRTLNVATEACRLAENGDTFIARVRAETGIELTVISTREEANFAVAGCLPLLDSQCGNALVFDVGGGSTELIWLDLANVRDPEIISWTSMRHGVVTLSEKHGGIEISPSAYAAMVDDVAGQLRDFELQNNLQRYFARGGAQMLGMSGTVTTLAGVHMGLRRYDRSRVDGAWMMLQDLRDVSRKITAMQHRDRVANPCVGPERADLVVAGCAILEAITDIWPAERVRVADRGLREGILTTLMRQDEETRRTPRFQP